MSYECRELWIMSKWTQWNIHDEMAPCAHFIRIHFSMIFIRVRFYYAQFVNVTIFQNCIFFLCCYCLSRPSSAAPKFIKRKNDKKNKEWTFLHYLHCVFGCRSVDLQMHLILFFSFLFLSFSAFFFLEKKSSMEGLLYLVDKWMIKLINGWKSAHLSGIFC